MSASSRSVPELEGLLRLDPWDAVTSRAWADALLAAGDPRGELVALEHTIRAAEPEEALALAARQSELWDDHEEALAGKSGGFPFRDPYKGRRVIRCYVEQALDGEWSDVLRRGRAFVERFTNARVPAVVGSYRFGGSPSIWLGNPIEPESEIERELSSRLAPAKLHHVSDGRRYVKRDDPLARAADEDALFALLGGLAPSTVRWTFSLTVPGTHALLPYQEGWLYGRPEPLLTCALQLETGGPARSGGAHAFVLDTYFPFDGFDEPAFDDYLSDVLATLGAAPPSRGLLLLEPELGSGPRLIAERIRPRHA